MNTAARMVAVIGILLAACMRVSAAVDPQQVRAELERIEDLRLLHRYAIQDLHDAKALAIYLAGWGGADRAREVEELLREASDLYEFTRGADYGGSGIQAEVDILGAQSPSPAKLELLQRARRDVARRVNDFYRRNTALKAELASQVTAAAQQKIKWELVDEPQPWTQPHREVERKAAMPWGWTMREDFFKVPQAEGDYILAKGAKSGIGFTTIVYAPVCNWGDIEREGPGKFDFTALDAAMERLTRHKMTAWIMLTTLTGSPPKWHLDQAGADSQFTIPGKDAKGQPAKVQSGINLVHAQTGEAFARFLNAYAAHLKQKWPQAVDAVFVEGTMHEIGAVADESKGMDAYWKAWSKTDTSWRTPESLADDEPARVRAEMCREQWLIDYCQRVIDGLHAGWPELPVQLSTANHDFHRLINYHNEPSRNLYRLSQLSPNPATGTTSPACYSLMRSFAGNRWAWHYFVPGGCGAKTGACNAEAPFQDISRICYNFAPGASLRHNFPAGWFRYSDWQMGDFGMTAYFLTQRRCQELAPVLLNATTPKASVAVLWSQTTLRRDPKYQLHKDAVAWGHLLRRIFVPFEYVPDEGLAQKLAGYKVLILPSTQSLTDQTISDIRAWTQQGGTLFAFGAPGIFDEFGKPRGGTPLADVFGADVDHPRVPGPVHPDRLYTGHPEGSYQSADPAPRKWQYESNLNSALKVTTAQVRAWFAGDEKDIAIVTSTFGQGKAMLSGYPLGFMYWESAPYEVSFGPTHNRAANYNVEQKHYEKWVATELEKLGVIRPAIATRAELLRAQKADDPDWSHTFRKSPIYSEYMTEVDEPARTIATFVRTREGIDNMYVGLVNTEMNYHVERGYFFGILSGGTVTASVACGQQPVVFDARLKVPVPATFANGRATFQTWIPLAQPSAFAIAPAGKVRLFGPASPAGEAPETIAKRSATYADDDGTSQVEILDRDQITAFLEARRGKSLLIGCGDTRFRPAADELSKWLKQTYNIDAGITTAGARISCRYEYMDGWGYPGNETEQASADILIGNCRDNGLMWRYVWMPANRYWLPLEINDTFPGVDRSVVMLSIPVVTDSSGKAVGKQTEQKLIFGASFPAEAMRAVKAVQ